MIRTITLVLAWSFIWPALWAQPSPLTQEEVLQGIIRLRSTILGQRIALLQDIDHLIAGIHQLDITPYQKAALKKYMEGALSSTLQLQARADHMRTRFKGKRIRKFVTEFLALADTLFWADQILFDLCQLDLLKKVSPYNINPGQNISDEIAFLSLKPGDKIAEIGAGSGAMSLLIASIPIPIDIYINELDREVTERIEQKSLFIKSLCAQSNIKVVWGSDKSTRLEEGQIDVIFMRNSFHHFKRKKKMLQSIKHSLAPDGRVVLTENVVDIEGIYTCPEAMSRGAILALLGQEGLHLVRERKLENRMLLEFQPSANPPPQG